jgi:hypothetical protein
MFGFFNSRRVLLFRIASTNPPGPALSLARLLTGHANAANVLSQASYRKASGAATAQVMSALGWEQPYSGSRNGLPGQDLRAAPPRVRFEPRLQIFCNATNVCYRLTVKKSSTTIKVLNGVLQRKFRCFEPVPKTRVLGAQISSD